MDTARSIKFAAPSGFIVWAVTAGLGLWGVHIPEITIPQSDGTTLVITSNEMIGAASGLLTYLVTILTAHFTKDNPTDAANAIDVEPSVLKAAIPVLKAQSEVVDASYPGGNKSGPRG